ncbi:hypothetical protein LSCM1_06406 [Leishmania martiniquensis]|uniref:RNA uridylyltransferase n=1 Tax=Leishmania martiniquensis TaxID=1580590 RepID=A0A836H5N5_9TRYP|nr:hypothetical protein LSCM1_06406 [Leishmania martiniquensis]
MLAGKRKFMAESIANYRALQPTSNDTAAIADLQLRILDLCSRCVNKAQLALFGSLATGFCTSGADADLSLTFRNFSPWLSGIQRVDEQNGKRLARVGREAGELGMENVRFINARIPVVQFRDPTSGIRCDITIGNVGGVENTRILAEIRRVLPDFYGAYVYLVKEWAKRCEVVAPEKSMLNSFTITTMSLMVLQELGLLPIFVPTGTYGELTLTDVKRDLSHFQLPPVYEGIEQDDERLGEAVYFCLLRFAEYYSKFDFSNGTVSLMCPRRHRSLYAKIVKQHMELLGARKKKEWCTYLLSGHGDGASPIITTHFPQNSFDEAMRSEAIQRQADTAFVVEDFVNYVNSGRRVPAARGPKVHMEFTRLYEQLRDEAHVCFHEVFRETQATPLTHKPDRPDPRVAVFPTKW